VEATFPEVAEALDGPICRELACTARLAFYRKTHLFDAQSFGEPTFIKPGRSITPVVFPMGVIGADLGLDDGVRVADVSLEKWLGCGRRSRCSGSGGCRRATSSESS
jgi:hypothetical protein